MKLERMKKMLERARERREKISLETAWFRAANRQ